MNLEQLKSRIEAVLFITARAISLDEIATILDEETETIEEAILEVTFFKLKKTTWTL